MRTIKFRAWDKTHKKMLDRVLAGPGDPCSVVWNDERKEWLNFDEACGTIMQFTGMHDRSGHEIYEGDRLRVEFPDYTGKEPDNGWVVWDNSEGSWRVQSYAWWSYIIPADMEVIGNIYENPDLLH